MITFIATFIIFGLVILGMSIGVLLAGRRIKGSCGGLNTIEGLEDACVSCNKPCDKKRKALEKLQASTDEKPIVLKKM